MINQYLKSKKQLNNYNINQFLVILSPDIEINSINMNKPLVIYGAGNLGKLAKQFFNQLNIKYELDEGDISELESKISKLRQKVDFTEGTYTWKWYHSSSDEIKNSLILEYIKRQIG